MRVANKTRYDVIKYNLNNITDKMNRANNVVASGKRILNLSDDPVGLTQVLNIKSSLIEIEQMGRNISFGKSWLTTAESALNHANDLISDTRALCVQMATATTGEAERASAAETVQNTLEEMISLANTDSNGRYVFAGSKTDTAPFAQDGTYSGDGKAFTVKIGRDATVAVGFDGESVFQPSGAGSADDLFQTMSDLKTALQNNNVNGIETAMTKLNNHFDHVLTKISDVGSKTVRMEIKERIFQDTTITNTERLSKIEDADITEAIIELKATELAYQAALSSSTKLMQLSLVDYV